MICSKCPVISVILHIRGNKVCARQTCRFVIVLSFLLLLMLCIPAYFNRIFIYLFILKKTKKPLYWLKFWSWFLDLMTQFSAHKCLSADLFASVSKMLRVWEFFWSSFPLSFSSSATKAFRRLQRIPLRLPGSPYSASCSFHRTECWRVNMLMITANSSVTLVHVSFIHIFLWQWIWFFFYLPPLSCHVTHLLHVPS